MQDLRILNKEYWNFLLSGILKVIKLSFFKIEKEIKKAQFFAFMALQEQEKLPSENP